jgi:hypothetical protein
VGSIRRYQCRKACGKRPSSTAGRTGSIRWAPRWRWAHRLLLALHRPIDPVELRFDGPLGLLVNGSSLGPAGVLLRGGWDVSHGVAGPSSEALRGVTDSEWGAGEVEKPRPRDFGILGEGQSGFGLKR